MRGHLLELDTMIPLSILNESTGSPAICQALILTASPKMLLRENISEHGMFFERHTFCHSDNISYRENSHDQLNKPF